MGLHVVRSSGGRAGLPVVASLHRPGRGGAAAGARAPLRELVLRHEAIPDFVGQEGRVVGMEAMVMPLEVARSLPLEGVRVGDKVEIVLEVDWSRPSYRVVQLRPLPSSTVLDLGRSPSR